MISKGYHFVINLGIASNIYISVDLDYPGSCARGSIPVHFAHSTIKVTNYFSSQKNDKMIF